MKFVPLTEEREQALQNELATLRAQRDELRAACVAILSAVADDPSLQEKLIIAQYGSVGSFAAALKRASDAVAKTRGEG
jgi:hypothetical protein